MGSLLIVTYLALVGPVSCFLGVDSRARRPRELDERVMHHELVIGTDALEVANDP